MSFYGGWIILHWSSSENNHFIGSTVEEWTQLSECLSPVTRKQIQHQVEHLVTPIWACSLTYISPLFTFYCHFFTTSTNRPFVVGLVLFSSSRLVWLNLLPENTWTWTSCARLWLAAETRWWLILIAVFIGLFTSLLLFSSAVVSC